MSFYKAFLTCAMQFYFPDLVMGKVCKENPNVFLVIPSKRTAIAYHGLWDTKYRQNLPENRVEGSLSGYREIRIEEWNSLAEGIRVLEPDVIHLRRFQPRAVPSGIRRGIELSEMLLSDLLQTNVFLTAQEKAACTEFAYQNTRTLKKKKQGPER